MFMNKHVVLYIWWVHITGVYSNYYYQAMITVYLLQTLNIVCPSLTITHDSDLRQLSIF